MSEYAKRLDEVYERLHELRAAMAHASDKQTYGADPYHPVWNYAVVMSQALADWYVLHRQALGAGVLTEALFLLPENERPVVDTLRGYTAIPNTPANVDALKESADKRRQSSKRARFQRKYRLWAVNMLTGEADMLYETP